MRQHPTENNQTEVKTIDRQAHFQLQSETMMGLLEGAIENQLSLVIIRLKEVQLAMVELGEVVLADVSN